MEDIFSNRERNEITRFSISDSKDLLNRGLEYFIGPSYQWLPEYDNIAKWLSNNYGKGLLCMGNCGRGKTLICQRVLPAIFESYLKIPYFIYESFELGHKIDDIRSFGKNIIIDDVGLEHETVIYGEKHNSFNEVVDIAEKRGILLVLTTNLTPEELVEKYGDRTLDRLRSLVKTVVFKGNSLR